VKHFHRKYQFPFLISILIGLINFSIQTNAQEISGFDRLNLDNGVIQSIVYEIEQDQYGNLWLATEEGVIRYNSKEAYLYNKFNGLPEGISNRINCIYIDKEIILIGTETGLCKFNPFLDKFEVIRPENAEELNVLKIEKDNYGSFWLSSYNGIWECKISGNQQSFIRIENDNNPKSLILFESTLLYAKNSGIYAFNLKTRVATKINHTPFSGVDISSVKRIDDTLYFGTHNGKLFYTNLVLSEFKEIPLQYTSNRIPIKDIEAFNHHFLVATDGAGILELNTNFGLIQQYKHNEDDNSTLSINGVYDLFVDNVNNLWVATYGGNVNYFNPEKNIFKTVKHQINNNNSISSSFSRSFLELKNGKIWIGTIDGINIWDKKNQIWQRLGKLNPNSSNEVILSMVEDGDDVWVSSYNDGVYRINTQTFSKIKYSPTEESHHKITTNKAFKLFKDRNQNIWIGGIDGNLCAIKPDGSIKVFTLDNIRDITQNKKGDIIIVGKNGVFSIDKSEKIVDIKELRPLKGELEYNLLNCVIEDSKGNIVLGSNGTGAIFYNPKNKSIKVFNTISDFPSDIVQGIIEYASGKYWMSTTKGLVHLMMNEKDTIIKIYNKADGLAGNEFNYNAFYKLRSGELLFGSTEGINYFYPDNILKNNYQPKIIFDEFSVFNIPVKPESKILKNHINTVDKINLKYSNNSIGIKFTGIMLGFHSKVNYTWKLEGFDKEWSKPGNKSNVNYTNLNYGDYIFRVKASFENGMWGEERILKIHINRPWYASFWAFLMYLFILSIIFYSVFRVTKLQEFKRSKEEQINMLNNITHEIKTPLSVLISTIKTGNELNTQKGSVIHNTIEQLNGLINQMLNFHLVTSELNLNQEVNKIKLSNYFKDLIYNFNPLLEEKELIIRFHNLTDKDIFYTSKTDFDKIMYNLLTNAIKYSKKNTTIDIKAIDNNKKNTFTFSVHDYGIGIPQDEQKYILNNYYRARNAINSQHSGTGLGLMIVKNLIEKRNGKITFTSELQKGTTFYVELPNQEDQYLHAALIPDQNVHEIDEKNIDFEKFSHYKILIVEDNDELRRNIVKTLEKYFLIFEATNGKEGIEKAKEIYPDLILTDYIMPEMDGMEMCNEIKDNINLNHIPIFMMTVLHSTTHKQESIEHGITEYIEKPLNLNILFAKINNILKWRETLREKYLHQKESESLEKYKSQKDSEFIEKLEKIILENILQEDFNIQEICLKLGMSRTSLYMKLKNLLNFSIQDFIIYTKLKFAKNLILKGEDSIKEVAYASGFSNPKHFSTSFRKAFGETPSDYIKKVNANIK
jgi:signal transduction histidine kinase/ligand-binding sensor domain-containing protein/CheY-like chemotaxis protein/AraC-like DNA-binding protein